MSPDWALCDGNGDDGGDHCCYVAGSPCLYLEVDGPSGRHYACGLRRELGDWALVHSDPRYIRDVKPYWVERGVVDCGPWWGCHQAQLDAVLARGSVTEAEFIAAAQCCFKRVWCATPQKVRQATNAISRGL